MSMHALDAKAHARILLLAQVSPKIAFASHACLRGTYTPT